MPDDLYDRDFYLWTQAQAQALRARGRGDNQIDYDVLAEEVEDMGRAERNKAASLASRIIQHFFYLAWSQRAEPRGGWRSEIRNFRDDLDRTLTPAIRRQVGADLEDLHLRAARAAQDAFESHEPGAPIDTSLRWSMAQIMGEQNDPIG